MGLITVVRHGQAGTFETSYDQLSQLGREQSRRLGEYWVGQGIEWDRVLIGPKLRHAETEACVREVYRTRGMALPAAEPLEDLDELAFGKIVAAMSKTSAGKNALQLHHVPESERPEALKAAFRHLFGATREYVTGKVEIPDGESWAQFRARAQRALDFMVNSGPGQRVLAFSSAGLTGMLVGCVLELRDDKIVDMMMQVRNGSYSSIMYSPGRRSLTSFNAVPHLPPQMWTVG